MISSYQCGGDYQNEHHKTAYNWAFQNLSDKLWNIVTQIEDLKNKDKVLNCTNGKYNAETIHIRAHTQEYP